jgi:hypothetical protein
MYLLVNNFEFNILHGFIVQLFCIRVQILTDFSDLSIRYSTIETKEAAHIGYNRFLFTPSLLAVILCLCF